MKKEYFRMIAMLTVITMVCGFLLAAVKTITQPKIEEQILINVKGPALKKVLNLSSNNPINDRIEVEIDDEIHTVFIGKKENKLWAVAFESKGTGFGGSIGVMIGIDVAKSTLSGIGILTHQETPGLGSRISETGFTDKFKGRTISDIFRVKKDNGIIDAISGATNSSRGVCSAVEKGVALFPKIKLTVLNKLDKKVKIK
ncbi:MAG: RnfABCDGE type electron transport complex subunit G [Acidobacteriota bacterium]